MPVTAEPLIEYFERTFALDESDKALVMARFRSRLYKKRQFVSQEGDVCNQFNFVVRGCLRLYRTDEKGDTHILQFATENNWINDLGSFHSRKPSTMAVDALEDTVVLQISHADLIFLYETSPRFDRIFRVLVENAFIRLQERLLQNISSTADERYQSFLETYPQLTNRLSQIQIAAFLGVTPEFLSRLRNMRSRSRSNPDSEG